MVTPTLPRIVVNIQNRVAKALAHEGHARVQAVFPFPGVTAQLVFEQIVSAFFQRTPCCPRVRLLWIIAFLIVRSERGLKPCSRVVAGMIWIDPSRIAGVAVIVTLPGSAPDGIGIGARM